MYVREFSEIILLEICQLLRGHQTLFRWFHLSSVLYFFLHLQKGCSLRTVFSQPTLTLPVPCLTHYRHTRDVLTGYLLVLSKMGKILSCLTLKWSTSMLFFFFMYYSHDQWYRHLIRKHSFDTIVRHAHCHSLLSSVSTVGSFISYDLCNEMCCQCIFPATLFHGPH